jgi:hypothetical protein
MAKDRWACLPLNHRFYHPKKEFEKQEIRVGREFIGFSLSIFGKVGKQSSASDVIEPRTYHGPSLPSS